MADFDREAVLIEIARLMWRNEMSIAELYETLGVDLEDLDKSDPTDVVSLLAGVFTGWKHPPENASTQHANAA